MYTQKVLERFKNPKNHGKMRHPDGVGKVGNIVCGDVMWLYIKVAQNKKGQEIIRNIKFETFGCVAAIATSSVITDLAKGKSITKALQITRDKVAKSLDGLPPIKMHCSVLAADALAEAIYDYLKRKKRKISPKLEKRHQRIAGERKTLETKYHDWISEEEKLHVNK